MSSPYSPPHTPAAPRSVKILDRTRMVVPPVCVACGSTANETITCGVLAIGGFHLVTAKVFIVKTYLYDVFYSNSGDGIRVGASLPYLKRSIAANPGNVDTIF
jgi:hypothetical protein